MIIFGFISSIFWALLIAIGLWVLCAFSGKFINAGYQMKPLLHLLCFAVFVPTVVLLAVVFTCNKVNRLVDKVDSGITSVLMADGKFVDQLRQQISQASMTKDAENLTDYLAENFSDKITSEYPMLRKYVDVDQILEKTDLGKQISNLSKGATDVGAGKAQAMIQAAAGGFTKGVKAKIKAARRKALISVIVLQAIAFGVVMYKAGNYRSPTRSNYRSYDYM